MTASPVLRCGFEVQGLMHDDLTNRRGLMRSIAIQAARRAREMAIAKAQINQQLAPRGATDPLADAASTGSPLPEFLPAQLTERCASCEELLELIDEHGLADRRDAIRARCRASLRLAPPVAGERFAPGAPGAGRVPEVEQPSWRGASLAPLLRLDLAEARAACPSLQLPATGNLLVFFLTGDSPSGLELDHGGACQVALEPSSGGQEQSASPIVDLSGELMLPRVWAESVDALGLSTEDQASWERLRRRLAEHQGVTAFDLESPPRAIHRVLGWPDERDGWMPLACALIDAGFELDGRPPAIHPRAREFSTRAGEWRLLLQLTAEPGLGWIWGGRDRLYLWIRERDLAAADFSRIRAIVP